MTNEERIAEIKARCEAATPGAWSNFDGWLIHTQPDISKGVPHEKAIGTVRKINADFIAHSREDIPFLIVQLTELKTQLKYRQEQLDSILILPSCNDCANTNCGYKPEWGESVRFNCPLHRKAST